MNVMNVQPHLPQFEDEILVVQYALLLILTGHVGNRFFFVF